MIKAVIFDLDNTLYPYDACNRHAAEAFLWACMQLCGRSRQECTALYEQAKAYVKVRLGSTAACHNRMLYAQRFLELAGLRPAENALTLYNAYWDTFLARMEPYPYVPALFAMLADRQIRIALLTDLTAQIQHRKIERLGIGPFVDVLVTSEEAGREKPDPNMFALVLEKLGLDAAQAVMVGDDQKKDMEGARMAGMRGIWFTREKQGSMIKACMEVIDGETKG